MAQNIDFILARKSGFDGTTRLKNLNDGTTRLKNLKRDNILVNIGKKKK